MLRIAFGDSWKHDPVCLEALRALARGRTRGVSPRCIVDVVRVEADGVDLARGLAEAVLIDAAGALVETALVLAGGETVRVVRLEPSPVALRFERKADALLMTVEGAGGTAVTIDMEPVRLLELARALVDGLISDLERIDPALAELRPLRALRRKASGRAPRWRKTRPHRTTSPIAQTRVGSLTLCVQHSRGHSGPAVLYALGPHGQRCWTGGQPAARALLELARVATQPAGEAGEGLVIDTTRRLVSFGGAPPVPLADLVEAVRSLASAVEPHTAPEERQLLADLPRALQHRAGIPAAKVEPARLRSRRALRPARAEELPSSNLRHLMLRRAWRADAPGSRPALHPCAGGVLVRAGGVVEFRAGTGRSTWSASLLDAQVIGGLRPRVVGRDSHGAVLLLDGETGRRMARHPALMSRGLRAVLACGEELALLGRRRLVRLAENGEVRWVFESWSSEDFSALCFAGSGVAVATESGEVGALTEGGELAWRRRLPLERLTMMRCLPRHAALLATGSIDGGRRSAVLLVDALTGELRWEAHVDGTHVSSPALLKNTVALGLDSTSGPALAGLSLRTGKVRWQLAIPGDGEVAPLVCHDRLLVPRAGGGLTACDGSGRLLYHHDACDPEPALSPAQPRGAVFGAGLVALPAAMVHVREVDSGRVVASVEPAELAPDACVLLDGPVLVVAGRDSGIVEAWRTTGHLRVVPTAE